MSPTTENNITTIPASGSRLFSLRTVISLPWHYRVALTLPLITILWGLVLWASS